MKKKLIKYFSSDKLKILDGGSPACKNYGLNYYNAVTFDYIYRYVLKRRFSKKNLAKCLNELINDLNIKIGPCSYIKNTVFFGVNNTTNVWANYWKDPSGKFTGGYWNYGEESKRVIELLNNNM